MFIQSFDNVQWYLTSFSTIASLEFRTTYSYEFCHGGGSIVKTTSEDPRLQRLCAIALDLPEASLETRGDHVQFLIRKKTFAYFLNNHHGDGIVGVTCRVLPGDNHALIAAHPRKFYMPAYVGARGWVGLRLDAGRIDWQEVAELLRGSYALVAPKRLAALIAQEI
jgi:hypothetical protein